MYPLEIKILCLLKGEQQEHTAFFSDMTFRLWKKEPSSSKYIDHEDPYRCQKIVLQRNYGGYKRHNQINFYKPHLKSLAIFAYTF